LGRDEFLETPGIKSSCELVAAQRLALDIAPRLPGDHIAQAPTPAPVSNSEKLALSGPEVCQ